jgi:TRAP-type C4-dicarboxylate transport system substrate-binding protein
MELDMRLVRKHSIFRSRWARIACVAAFVSWLTFGSAQAQVLIKVGSLVPAGTKWRDILAEGFSKWEKISGGKIKVQLYWGTQGDDPDLVLKMNLGTLNAAVLTSVGIAEIDRSIYALSIPMMYRDYDEAYAVFEKVRPKLEAGMEAKGFTALSWMDGGWLHFFSKKPVLSPEDLKKLVLFQWQGDAKTNEIWKAAGFNPRPGATSDLVTGLQTGQYEAFTASSQIAVIMRYYENAKNMTDINWALVMGGTVIKKDVWDRIPADLKPALKQVMIEAGEKMKAAIRQDALTDVQSMKTRGLNVVTVDEKNYELWRAAVDKAKLKIRGDFVPAEAYDAALKYRDDYRSQKAPKK